MITQPAARRFDFRVSSGGEVFATVFMLFPMNDDARAHLAEHLADDAQWLGGGVAVEHRYIADLVARLIEDGFSVS